MPHGVPLYISKDHVGFFFSKFGGVADMSTVKSKARIATDDVNANILTCGSHHNYVVVEGQRLLCWACRAAEHLLKLCLGKKTQSHPQPNTAKSSGDWTEVVKKGGKPTTHPQ